MNDVQFYNDLNPVKINHTRVSGLYLRSDDRTTKGVRLWDGSLGLDRKKHFLQMRAVQF